MQNTVPQKAEERKMRKINPSSLVNIGYQIALYCYPVVPLVEKEGSSEKKNTLGYVEYHLRVQNYYYTPKKRY